MTLLQTLYPLALGDITRPDTCLATQQVDVQFEGGDGRSTMCNEAVVRAVRDSRCEAVLCLPSVHIIDFANTWLSCKEHEKQFSLQPCG